MTRKDLKELPQLKAELDHWKQKQIEMIIKNKMPKKQISQ
jgi:hypothetical protein